MTATDVRELVDVDEWLDRKHTHAHCTRCWPSGHAGLKIALCGAMKRSAGGRADRTMPRDACPECADLWHQPCRECGI